LYKINNMPTTPNTPQDQEPVNGYFLRAIGRISVPDGEDEIEVEVAGRKVKVTSSKDSPSVHPAVTVDAAPNVDGGHVAAH